MATTNHKTVLLQNPSIGPSSVPSALPAEVQDAAHGKAPNGHLASPRPEAYTGRKSHARSKLLPQYLR